MCIIAVCNDRPLTRKECKRCWNSNSDGAGVAWIEKKVVRWKKGFMTLDDLEKWYFKLSPPPLPHVIHFRSATAGDIIPELTHPFVMDVVKSTIKGKTKRGVLFHNGVITNWEIKLDLIGYWCIKNSRKLPEGQWSDSRAVAALCGILGIDYLRAQDGKWVMVVPSGIFTFGAFVKKDGVLFSNTGYLYGGSRYYYGGKWWDDYSTDEGWWKKGYGR